MRHLRAFALLLLALIAVAAHPSALSAAIATNLEYTETAYGGYTTLTLNKPTNTADGDFLLAAIRISSGDAVSAPAGWTLISDYAVYSTTRVLAYYKRASSEGASWNWTHSYAGSAGMVKRFTGVVATGSPEDCTLHTYSSGYSDPAITTNAVTTATDGACLVQIAGALYNGSWASSTMTSMSSQTHLRVSGGLQATAGASGNKSTTCNAGAEIAGSIMIALKPAGGGGTDGTATLSGSAGTASRGTLAVTSTADVALSGSSATASRGTIAVTNTGTATLSGQSSTASRGTLGVTGTGTVVLSGSAATASRGTLTAPASGGAALSGSSATASRGTLAIIGTGTAALSGSAATASRGTLGVSGGVTGDVVLSGQSATSSRGTLSVGSTGDVALSGSSATAARGNLAVSAGVVGNVTIAGSAAASSRGTLTVAGSAAPSLAGASVTASRGTLGVAGTSGATVPLSGAYLVASAGTLGVSDGAAPPNAPVFLRFQGEVIQ